MEQNGKSGPPVIRFDVDTDFVQTEELYHTFIGHFEEVTSLLSVLQPHSSLLSPKTSSARSGGTASEVPQQVEEDNPQEPMLSAEEEALLDKLMRVS